MKLTVFRSDKGDCLLLSTGKGIGKAARHVLVDGGMRESYSRHVAASLSRLKKIDLVYVSHIDQDHISGVLQLMDDVVKWRVHEFQRSNGNKKHPVPSVPRPPAVAAIWHNAFHEQIGKNAGPVADMLAATAIVLSGAGNDAVRELSEKRRVLATSTKEAIQLSRRIGDGQLGIPLNPQFGGKLMFVNGKQPAIRIGGMSFFVIGPFEEDLRALRKEWNEWLRKHKDALRDVQRAAKADEDRLGNDEVDRLLGPMIIQADELGRREKVTTPNLASLMVLVEEKGKSVLLTGDGHHVDILKGLDHHGRLVNGGIHVNVLKVQHHGSEHNLDESFCRRVTADHYVFCANGAHKNPDTKVVEAIIHSRTGDASKRSKNPGANGRFRLWFNGSSRADGETAHKKHMAMVEKLVKKAQSRSKGQMSSHFMAQNADSFAIDV